MTTTMNTSVLVLTSFLCFGCGVTTVQPFVDGIEAVDGGSGGVGGAPIDASVGDCQSDLDCPPGEECEIEDGSSFCKPHGGSGGGGGEGGRSGSNSGPG
ncbi:MAG: hypothetical protein JRH14_06380 [Deltaproteobacteria bacterium]|nr:hypothetical protein [Deltaproteobacteria bacterium]